MRSATAARLSAHPATVLEIPLDLFGLLALELLGAFSGYLRARQLDGIFPLVGDLRSQRTWIAQLLMSIFQHVKLVMRRLALE